MSYGGNATLGSGDSGTLFKYVFKASDGSPVYGNSDTVQPPALQLIPQIKY